MIEYFNKICQMIANHPLIVSLVCNLVLGGILFIALWLPQKFINRELRKNRKSPINKFDKILILLSGLIFSTILCIVGSEFLSVWSKYPISKELTSILVIFSNLGVLLRTLVHVDLANRSEIPSHVKVYRIAFISIAIIMIFNILTVRYPKSLASIFSYIVLAYYFIEACVEKNTIKKCFTVLRSKEYSIGAKLVDLINRKFTFVVLIGLIAVPLITKKHNIPDDVLLYSNILYMFSVWGTLVALQIISSALVNQFVKKLTYLEAGKSSKKSAKLRKKNLLWICDVLVIAFYLSIAVVVLWILGIDIQKYILHDNIFAIGLIVFVTVLLYNAFREFTDALIDKANPVDHEKILTFMPLITVTFNVVLLCASALLILSKMGIPTAPLFTSFAAFWGLVVLSAQDIFKAFLQGIILLFESNFYLGDFVTINGNSGTVIKISTRTVTIRSASGDEHSIPYNTIGVITNHSREFFLHNESLLISPRSDIKKACSLLIQVVEQLKSEEAFSDKILGDVHIAGVKSFTNEGVQICWTLKTTPISGRFLQLEIYRRLFPLLQQENIRIPYRQEYSEYLLTSQKQENIKII